MNSKERIEAVLALERADRTPVAPWLDHFAASYAGITKAELIEEPKKRIEAVIRTATEMGPWDMTYMAENASRSLLMAAPARVRWPGRDLPADEIHQFEEFELLTPDDYDLLVKAGLTGFLGLVGRRLYPDLGTLKGLKMGLSFAWTVRKHARMIEAAGMVPAAGFMHPGPLFEYFSIGRSMGMMCMDLFDRPDKVKAAGRVWGRALTAMAIRFARLVGVPRIFIGLSRSSPAMISPRHFEEFVWLELELIVNMIIDAGMTPVLHCDTDWTRSLHLFSRLPAGKCIMELDGDTDIRKAGEVLGGRICIKGDVPAYLLAFRPASEVRDYCRLLIREVGAGGGFILSSGCSVPANARAENVRAMFEAALEG